MYLQDELKACFNDQTPLFTQLMNLSGESYRQLEGRVTLRIILGGRSYFLKRHTGIGYQEIIKNLFQGKLPVVSAKNEWLALEKCHGLGLSVAGVAGFGCRGLNPARRQSFVLMEDLSPAVSLEDYCQSWKMSAPFYTNKQKIIKKLAEMTRILHEGGVNHRDLYLCHFLLVPSSLAENDPTIYLIDLHRAQIRKSVPERWLIKDLAGLYFSSLGLGLKQSDYFRFMTVYTGKRLREIVKTQSSFWEKVKKRGAALYCQHTLQR